MIFRREISLLLKLVLLLFSFLLFSCEKKEISYTLLSPNKIYQMRPPKSEVLSKGCILITTDHNEKGLLLDRIFLINRKGKILKKWRLDSRTKYATLDKEGNLWALINKSYTGKLDPLITKSTFIKLNKEGETIYEKEFFGAHHKFSIIDSSKVIFPTFSKRKYKDKYFQDRLVILNLKTGKIEKSFEMANYFPQAENVRLNSGQEITRNIHHINSIEYRKNDPLFKKEVALFSIRNLNKVAILDLKEEKILWESKIPGIFQGHNARFLDNGDILYFNNGREESEVIQIDPLENKVVWKFKNRFQFHSHIKGGAQRLPNGNTLILQSQKAHLFEVNALGEVLMDLFIFFPQDKRKAWSPVAINMFEAYPSDYFRTTPDCQESF